MKISIDGGLRWLRVVGTLMRSGGHVTALFEQVLDDLGVVVVSGLHQTGPARQVVLLVHIRTLTEHNTPLLLLLLLYTW